MKQWLVVALVVTGCSTVPRSATPSEANDVNLFVAHVLRSFENLDLAAFSECFTDDASVFFPLPEPQERFDGRAAIRAHFAQVFAAIRAQATTGPPYHRLEPKNLRVDWLGPASAVVTFELVNEKRHARRTLAVTLTERGWRIVHLHASTLTLATP